MTKGTTTHRWTQDELDYLIKNAEATGDELVSGFRKTFKDFPGSDQSIKGRRYGLLHRSSDPGRKVQALESRVEAARTKLAQLESDLADARAAVEPVDWAKATMAELREAAKAAGVTPDGRTKDAFVAALTSAA